MRTNKMTFIIPVHKIDKETKPLLARALQSIKDASIKDDAVIVVGPESVLSEIDGEITKAKVKSMVKKVTNEGDTDFFSQVNAAVMKCTTKFFCVVELDDFITEYWPEEAEKYIASTNASILLPLNNFIKDEQWMSFGNEMAWSTSFADNLGEIGLEELDKFMDFNVTGAFINTEDFIRIGGLKPSLMIAAWYEFLLRACHNSLKVCVAPKIGYTHTIGRNGSLMEETAKTITKEHGTWLIETAKQEYFFKDDRKKAFEGK